jgi:hypothetical protein
MDRRRLFLKNLGRDLCLRSVIKRSQEPLTTNFYFVKIAMENCSWSKISSILRRGCNTHSRE